MCFSFRKIFEMENNKRTKKISFKHKILSDKSIIDGSFGSPNSKFFLYTLETSGSPDLSAFQKSRQEDLIQTPFQSFSLNEPVNRKLIFENTPSKLEQSSLDKRVKKKLEMC